MMRTKADFPDSICPICGHRINSGDAWYTAAEDAETARQLIDIRLTIQTIKAEDQQQVDPIAIKHPIYRPIPH